MATLNDIEALKQQLRVEGAVGNNPYQDRVDEEFVHAAIVQTALNAAGGGGGGPSLSQTDIIAAINAAAFNTSANSRYGFQLAADDNGNYVVRFDKQTGTTASLTLAGSAYVPVNPVPVSARDTEIQTEYFEAITANAGNWAVEDVLTRVRIWSGSTLTSTLWFKQNDSSLAVVPVIGVDVTAASRVELDQLRTLQAIATGGNTLLNAINTNTDTIEPTLTDSVADGAVTDTTPIGLSIPRLLRGSLQRLIALLSSVGDSTDVSTVATNAAAGTLKSLTRRGLDLILGVFNKLPTLGQQTSAASISTVISSDQAPTVATQAWFTQVTDGTNFLPMGDSADRSIVTSLQVTGPTAAPVPGFTSGLGLDVYGGTATSFCDLKVNDRDFQQVSFTVRGNTAITGGAITIEGSSSPTGPFVTLDGVIGQSTAVVPLVTPVTSDQTLVITAINPLALRYVRLRVSTSFTGAATGVLVERADLFPIGTIPPVLLTSPPNNASTNLTQLNGVTVSTGTGASGPGTIRVAQAQITTNFIGAVPQTVSDYSVAGRIRKMKVLNESGATLYLQIHNNAAALTSGSSVPQNGLVWRIPNNTDVFFGVGEFGNTGTFFSTSTRVAVSSTRNVYTALTAPQLAATALFVEGV